MRPQPPTRRTPASLPKATGPDPAALTADTSNSRRGSSASSAGRAGGAGSSVAKLTIRIDPDLLGRARSAWRLQAADPGPYPSFGSWVAGLIEEAVAVAEHHHGGRLTPTPPGAIPNSHPRTGA
ncbi:hypothetical protein D5R93_02230 [Actinomyces lilanjuaniae]|uniref:Centromere-binding protein ParB C-terminal domain-containing protein n=1 Tax=Actinomyces lilanjuaniae TaxID=2321394 RepID=A0ABM6Z206_9ACTO|nr:hypothetical protein [Actinomyces lilanjuaniae]AYD89165.1 hypothetical protein D5R93_02230 [Actinomyces lilanjuaniae]